MAPGPATRGRKSILPRTGVKRARSLSYLEGKKRRRLESVLVAMRRFMMGTSEDMLTHEAMPEL